MYLRCITSFLPFLVYFKTPSQSKAFKFGLSKKLIVVEVAQIDHIKIEKCYLSHAPLFIENVMFDVFCNICQLYPLITVSITSTYLIKVLHYD